MREMMALTEQPDVISLAGGLPDTSTFAPELYAKLMSQVAATATARALQYGPTEGMAATVDCIVEVMAAEGTQIDPGEVLVTTGGQQVIDLVCKTLIDPGDVIVAEAPTYPGAIPTFSAYQAQVEQIEMDGDGMPIDELERTLDRLQADGRRPKFIYTIPNFQNPGGVTMSLARRRRLVEVAHERELLILEDNPYGLLRYEGEPLPTLHSLDAQLERAERGGRPRHLPRHVLEDPLARAAPRLGGCATPGAREAEPWQAGSRPLLIAGHAAVRRRVLQGTRRQRAGTLARLPRAAQGPLPPPSRRDARSARASILASTLAGPSPQGGLFIWATLDERIDTTDLLAQARKSESVAFVPGRAAYMDGRRGASSMRLNFAGVPDDEIREGIRRIGKVVRQQLGLYGTLTGSSAAARRRSKPPATPTGEPDETKAPLADVVAFPRRDQDGSARRRQDR